MDGSYERRSMRVEVDRTTKLAGNDRSQVGRRLLAVFVDTTVADGLWPTPVRPTSAIRPVVIWTSPDAIRAKTLPTRSYAVSIVVGRLRQGRTGLGSGASMVSRPPIQKRGHRKAAKACLKRREGAFAARAQRSKSAPLRAAIGHEPVPVKSRVDFFMDFARQPLQDLLAACAPFVYGRTDPAGKLDI
jgi:hypothetical protein